MLSRKAIYPYPWPSLEVLDRNTVRRARALRAAIPRALEPARLAGALAELLGVEVKWLLRRETATDLRLSLPLRFSVLLGRAQVEVVLSTTPELAAQLLGLLLKRPMPLFSVTQSEAPALAGAFSALLCEVGRRVHAAEALEFVYGVEPQLPGFLLLEGSLSVAGQAFPLQVRVGANELVVAPAAEPLQALHALPLNLRLILGAAWLSREEMASLEVGGALVLGAGLWINRELYGRAALAAPFAERGVGVTLSNDGRLTLTNEVIDLAYERDSNMPAEGHSALSDVVLDSPVLVRVELGAVSMSAREWAELRVGDVIETGRRIPEPVLLRVAGKEVARGELVSVDGELGVRIRELLYRG